MSAKDLQNDKAEPQDGSIILLYNNLYKDVKLHETYIEGINEYCRELIRFDTSNRTGEMVAEVQRQIERINRELHFNFDHQNVSYPIPYAWNFVNLSGKTQEAARRKKYTCSLVIETIFNEKVHKKIRENEKHIIKGLSETLKNIGLKQFLIIRKIA